MFIKSLRSYFTAFYSEQDLARWFDPLTFRYEEQADSLYVNFPHTFFKTWFAETVLTGFTLKAQEFQATLRIIYDGLPEEKILATRPLNTQVRNETKQTPVEPVKEEKKILPQQTFANFLSNRKNDFPLAVAQEAVAQSVSPHYSPLVFYGQSGSGKTHILSAIGHVLQEKGVAIIHGGTEILEKLRDKTLQTHELTAQCVLIDDIQRVGENTEVQEVLITLLDTFRKMSTLFVLSMETHPTSSTHFNLKLRARLTSGLVVELKKPDLDIRRQYVQLKDTALSLDLTKEEIFTLAQRYQDLRAIDGVLTRLTAFRSLVDKKNANLAAIMDSDARQKYITPAAVIGVTAKYFSVTPDDVTGKSRDKTATEARHIAMFLCRELLGLSLMQVGRFFSGRDHTSVLYSIKKIKQLQESNKVTNNHVSQLKKLCLNTPQ